MGKIKNKKFLKIALAVIMLFSVLMFASIISAQDVEPISAIRKIQSDYNAKKITFDEYILYKAWAVFKPEKLSRVGYELSAEDAKFRKDGTPIILEIKKNWDKLSPETQNILKCDVLLRPDDASGCGGYDPNVDTFPYTLESANFVVHFNVTGANATDTAYAQTISDYFEDSYDTEVTTLGYIAPPSDLAAPNNGGNAKYDVYIYDLGSGLYGYTCPEEYPSTPSYSYIALNIDYSWAPPNDDPVSDTIGAIKVTAAHELFHAIQYNYDVTEEPWWMETTATYMEDEVYPEVNDNYNYLPRWFEYCDTYGLKTFNEPYPGSNHEYGNFIFAKRLSEQFGDNIIKEIWVECQTTNGLTAIENVLLGKHSTLENEFAEFAKANFFLEDMYVDGADYRAALTGTTTFDGVWIEHEYNAATDVGAFFANRDAWMDQWAADYITLTLTSSSPTYTIDFDGLDNTTNYLVKLVTKKGLVFNEQTFSLDAQKNGQISLAYDTYDKVVLIIMNAGNTNTTDPSWYVTITRGVPLDNGGGGGFSGDLFAGDGFEGNAFGGDEFSSGGGGGKSGCFIATACFGTPMADEVKVLNRFRDEYLLLNPVGKVFVNTYYKISPPIADFIQKHPILKSMVRGILRPTVWLAKEVDN